jgi:hypothetical protein
MMSFDCCDSLLSQKYSSCRETEATVLFIAQSQSDVNGKYEGRYAVNNDVSLKISSFVVSLPSAARFGQDEMLLLAIGIPLAILWFSTGILMVRSMETNVRESI